ncbi:hypothetical protein [Rhodococcus sp. IEGM 1408]|uniref:hypothetical protein n=1 Tax=Rhodococcus sp. IEGM 1408 TaxID=3082220 RepID=UPI0029549CF8|nr:hypothetical protein [Rhodococcus sp. IEGM 1408]MDV8001424.1 hypothetical protein [Rhodococcus sp. IEGM 1408]
MSSCTSSPEMMGRRTQFSILELGVGASLAAVVALGAALFAVTQDPADSPAATRITPPPAVVSVP